MLLTFAVAAASRRVRHLRIAAALVRAYGSPPFGRLILSVWIGALSHVVFDFVSHGNFLLLMPWYAPRDFFPAWWNARWFEVPMPGYPEAYPIGPHFVVWTLLSIVGAIMFFRPRRADR